MAERKVIFKHTVSVDSCIADELEQLNNKHGIVTEYSCCGHGEPENAYIAVREEDQQKMIKLGYRLDSDGSAIHITVPVYGSGIMGQQVRFLRIDFRPKSRCRCRKRSRTKQNR